MKSRALHRLYINCTESSASRPWEGSQLSLMSKPSPAKERFGFFLQGSLLCSTSVSVTFPLSMCNPDYTDTTQSKTTLILPMCCFFSSVLGDPSPSCLPISLNSYLVRRGGNTWAGFACSGWLVAFLLQQWLGASSHITVNDLCFWLSTAPRSCINPTTSRHKHWKL